VLFYQHFLLAEAFQFSLKKLNKLAFKFRIPCSHESLQFYRFHAIICQYFGANQTLWALLAVDSGISKSMFKIGFLVFIFFSLLNFPALTLLTLIFDFSVVIIAEVVVETLSDIRCPLTLVLDSPLSASHVLAVGSRITYMSMVKYLLKITKKVTKTNLILALTNKPTDDQMHERNKCTKKQTH
jgi:hypothetical protein